MWTWKHLTGYPEDQYEEAGLSTKEIVQRLKDQNPFYYEDDEIVLDNPNPSYEPWRFLEEFGNMKGI